MTNDQWQYDKCHGMPTKSWQTNDLFCIANESTHKRWQCACVRCSVGLYWVMSTVSPKFLHVPLGLGGWPLGYERLRCWANCLHNYFPRFSTYMWSWSTIRYGRTDRRRDLKRLAPSNSETVEFRKVKSSGITDKCPMTKCAEFRSDHLQSHWVTRCHATGIQLTRLSLEG